MVAAMEGEYDRIGRGMTVFVKHFSVVSAKLGRR